MKKNILLKSLFCFMLTSFLFTSCIDDGSTKHLGWEDVDITSLRFYDANISVVTKDEEKYIQYSLFDSSIASAPERLNQITEKSLVGENQYNICGFEGKLCYGVLTSGKQSPLSRYGFVFNVDMDTNNCYTVSLLQSGTCVISSYVAGSSTEGSSEKGVYKDIAEFTSLTYGGGDQYLADPVSVKVSTNESGGIDIYVNGTYLYTIKGASVKYGSIGVFQMLNSDYKNIYSTSNPLLSYYQLNRIQRY